MSDPEKKYGMTSHSMNQVLIDDVHAIIKDSDASQRVGESSIVAIRCLSGWLSIGSATAMLHFGYPAVDNIVSNNQDVTPLSTLGGVIATVVSLGVLAKSLEVQWKLPRSHILQSSHIVNQSVTDKDQ